MSFVLLALLSTLNAHAMNREIPPIALVDWQCEEGMGNLESRAPLVSLSGAFATAVSRELSLNEKEQLQITVYLDGYPIVLNPHLYRAVWRNDGDFASLTITAQELSYRFETTPGNDIIVRVTSPSFLWGTKTRIGLC
jgi:hypothetical protein